METKSNTVSFTKNSTNVFFHILTGCNLSCRHCYINRDQHGKNTLDIEVIEEWLGSFSGKSSDANVIFLGGEPTMHPELPRAVKKARELGYNSITVDTNGYLFHDFLSKVEPSEIDFLSFSLDGATKETNDSIRGEGCYEKCTSGIKEAVSKGFKTSLIYTVSGSNIHELHLMPELLEKLGIDKFFIQVLGIRGTTAQDSSDMHQVTKSEWEKVVPEVARIASEKGIPVTYPKVFLEAGEHFECAGNVADNYFIFPNGRVYRCPLCEDYPLHSLEFKGGLLSETGKVNEADLFKLEIGEGCVMNKLVQPQNLNYNDDGTPEYRIACCLLKEEVAASVK